MTLQMMSVRVWTLPALILLLMLHLTSTRVRADVLDAFNDAGAWSLIVADGVKGTIVEVDGALRLDYDFTAGAGYCVVHRELDVTLDPNYRFGFRFRGSGPRNTLEFKLIDPSGENVWWSVERDVEFPSEWTPKSIRRRHLSFAWGPSDGKPLARVGAIEFAVTASKGGKGSIWLDDLVYERLPDTEPLPVEPLAITGDGTELGVVQSDGTIEWVFDKGGSLDLVFDSATEFSAIELEWADGGAPEYYRVMRSIDRVSSDLVFEVTDSDGGVDRLFTPETEARVVRIEVDYGSGSLRAIRFSPVEEIVHANDYLSWLAESAPRGSYPLYFGELSPWTVIGLPGSPNEALMSATGAIEPVKAGYSLEPFVLIGDRVHSWADASVTQSLEDGSLPIPSVRWELDGMKLDITAMATDISGDELLLARYCVTNTTSEPKPVTLVLAARPMQVLPAAQFLNTIGGAAYAESVTVGSDAILIDNELFVCSKTMASDVLTTDTLSGSLVDRLLDGSWNAIGIRGRSSSFPTAAMMYAMPLKPGESRTVVVTMPMESVNQLSPSAGMGFDAVLEHERARWTGLLNRTDILVPEHASELRDTIRANLAYILINADGAGIQPGSRSYERSWIRDGAMTSAALIALGHKDEARAFIEWYSAYQYSDGKIPCVVDARGPDPVDENDAPGEFIFAIRNSAEAGGGFDESFARAMYPKVHATVGYIESKRNTRLADEYTKSDDPIQRAKSGLMPQSISHEGYSAKPMHSYWDDFWVYRGLLDASEIADQLGESEDFERFSALADAFGQSIADSVIATTSIHGINYVPGCVELGDFDATSTSIAYYPTHTAEVLDQKLLESTFERAWQSTKERIDGSEWEGMTPYEVRIIGTFIRLGWIDRAHAYLDWLMDLRDPAGWRQWGEIAYREREPSLFVGDMPHTWVGSGAVLSILSMFAYEREDTLVLFAGIPADWLNDAQPIGVRNQVTRYGSLSYTIRSTNSGIDVQIEPGCDPDNGFVLKLGHLLSADSSSRIITVNGQRVQVNHDGDAFVRSIAHP